MTRNAGICVVLVLALIGCGVGDEGGGGDDDEVPIDHNPEGIVCFDIFKTTGTMAPAAPLRESVIDPDTGMPVTGCWPVGTWTFSASTEPSDENIPDITGDKVGDRCGKNVAGTTAATQLAANYSFTFTRMIVDEEYIDTMMFNGDAARLFRLKVSEGGGGECEGGLELVSVDRKEMWNFKPALTGTTIDGFGEYRRYIEPIPPFGN